MKRHLPLATLSLALAAIYPATVCAAGANDALLKELQELKARMAASGTNLTISIWSANSFM